MANELLVKVGATPLVWADNAGDFGDSPIAGTDQITLVSLADGAARQGDKGDFTALRAGAYSVTLRVEFDVAPVSGTTVSLYFAPSVSGTAATANPGGVSGSDAAYTGTAGDSLADSLKQLDLIGVLTCTADAATVVQQQTFVYSPSERYGTPVVFNEGGQAFEGDDIEMSIIFNPIIQEIQ
jgi:hypothetical protein